MLLLPVLLLAAAGVQGWTVPAPTTTTTMSVSPAAGAPRYEAYYSHLHPSLAWSHSLTHSQWALRSIH